MAEVGIKDVAKGEVALERLNVIELRPATDAVEQVLKERHDVIADKERGHGTDGRRYADESYSFRTRIFEFNGKNRKFMLRGKRA